MDKPKINFVAWEPLEKRKKKNRNNQQMIDEERSKDFDWEKYILSKKREEDKKENPYNTYVPRTKQIDDMKTIYDIEIDERLLKKGRKKYRRNRAGTLVNPQLLKSIFAGFMAIGTGLIFGYFLLLYFAQPGNNLDTMINTSNDTNTVSDNNSNSISTNNHVIAMDSLYFLQAGVFSEQTGAKAVLTNQHNQGKAAVIDGSNPYHVYVGISTDKASGTLLKEYLKTQGMDLYLKEHVIPNYKGSMSNSTYQAFSKWVIVGDQLLQSLARESIQVINDTNHTINYEELQKLHQNFLVDYQNVKSLIAKEGLTKEESAIQSMSEQINYAIAAINAYKKNPTPQYLWNIQELLIKYELSYEGLVSS